MGCEWGGKRRMGRGKGSVNGVDWKGFFSGLVRGVGWWVVDEYKKRL